MISTTSLAARFRSRTRQNPYSFAALELLPAEVPACRGWPLAYLSFLPPQRYSCQADDQRKTFLLESVLKSYPNLTINIPHVDADMRKRAEELRKKGRRQ